MRTLCFRLVHSPPQTKGGSIAFTLDNVVPWGRSMEEYAGMFALSRGDVCGRILGCADGPASFNAQMHALGHNVTSIDPVYAFSAADIRGRIAATYPTIMQQLRDNRGDYVWDRIASPEALGQMRMAAMEQFLTDLPGGVEDGRYLAGELPSLPLKDQSFDLALCSHFLFLYSDHLSEDFHCRAIQELLRVAREVRIFPLVTLGGQSSPHLDAACRQVRASGYTCTIRTVDYEFQRGANQMLQIG